MCSIPEGEESGCDFTVTPLSGYGEESPGRRTPGMKTQALLGDVLPSSVHCEQLATFFLGIAWTPHFNLSWSEIPPGGPSYLAPFQELVEGRSQVLFSTLRVVHFEGSTK